MRRILITGAAGFIGRRMMRVVEARGCEAIGMDRRAPAGGTGNARFLVTDFVGDRVIEVPSGVDTVIHLAGKAHALAEVAQDEAEYFRMNTEGTRKVLEAARRAGVRAFVLFSTVKAMGDSVAQTGPIDESNLLLPNTPYGKSKFGAEKLVLDGGYVSHPAVIRPCLVYGPTPKGNLEKMIEAVRRGRFPPIPEVGNKRSMVHLDDVIEAALLMAEHPSAKGQVFIAADNEPFSTRQLFEWISQATGRKVPGWSVPLWALRVLGRLGDGIGKARGRRFMFDSDSFGKLTSNAWYTSAKLQRELGWRPKHTLRETLPEIVAGSVAQRAPLS